MNPTQQYKGNQKSGFKRKRNESGNDEVGASKIRKKMRDMQRLLKNKVKKKKQNKLLAILTVYNRNAYLHKLLLKRKGN
jgi:hypothetical protein